MMRILIVSALFLHFLSAGAANALAQADGSVLSQSIGWAIFKTIIALLFILGLFFLLVYLLKRYYPKAFGGNLDPKQKGEGIDILTIRPLGGKRFLYLVRVGGRRILIGMTESQVQALSEWEEQDKDSNSSSE